MRKSLLLSLLVLLTPSAMAETISLDYKGFYDRLKVIKKGEYHSVDIAFSVPNIELCKINAGSITTDKKDYPLTYSQDQRLYIPFDDELKQDRALINLDITGEAKNCAIAMQVRAINPKKQYGPNQLDAIKLEMDEVLDALQGFPLKYFRQPINGLTFEFTKNQTVEIMIDEEKITFKGRHQLSVEQLSQINTIEFSELPKVISPWVL